MKKTILATMIALACTATSFAAGERISTNRVGINADYTVVDVDNGDWNLFGATIQGSHDFYQFENGITLTATGAAFFGTGSLEFDGDEGIDTNRYGIKAGLNFNYAISANTSIFAGPTLGCQFVTYDSNDGVEIDDDKDMTYGLIIGVRYMLNNQKTYIEGGISHDWNKSDKWTNEDGDDSYTSNTFFIGVHHTF